MFKHYLKIAFRNIRKYALQNIFCILGLATGFVCFCLTSICVHYENTYDTCHRDWQNLWTFDLKNGKSESLRSEFRPFEAYAPAFSDMTLWPEIEMAVPFTRMGGAVGTYRILIVDNSFADMFDLEMVEGDWDFMKNNKKMAISESFAKKYFGDVDPIGKTVNKYAQWFFPEIERFSVGAVIRDFSHSFFKFDIIIFENPDSYRFNSKCEYIFKVKPGTDMEALSRKVSGTMSVGDQFNREYVPVNIRDMHKIVRGDLSELDFDGVTVISTTSLLLIICSIVNFLIFFISSLSDRSHEMGLRVVCGSSALEVSIMLSVYITIVLAIAFAIGTVSAYFLVKPFCAFAGFDIPDSYFLKGSLLFMLIILTVSVILCGILSHLVSGKLLHNSVSDNRKSNLLCQIGIAVQLTFSMFFIFVTVCICNQYAEIFSKDWGFSMKNTASLHIRETYNYNIDCENLTRKILELPMVDDALLDNNLLMGGVNVGYSDGIISLSPESDGIPVCSDGGIRELWKPIYGFSVVQGVLPERRLEGDEIVITNDVARQLGLTDEIGQTVYLNLKNSNSGISAFNDQRSDVNLKQYTIVAVLKEIYFAGPVCRPLPMFFVSDFGGYYGDESILIKYKEGTSKLLTQQLQTLLEDIHVPYSIYYSEDTFKRNLNSTNKLLILMALFSVICMLISVFGVWSVITLSCRKQRREIAIRKTFGARNRDIYSAYLHQYGQILLISAIPAFSFGFLFIDRWREQFQQQAAVYWWIYFLIILGMAVIIGGIVVSGIRKSVHENPYEVIKNE